ncbi:peptidoglycan-binding domain-containing protein [Larkinella soli]|uniref:peptidoglycan-binding domain-containing protein n=1 Tax=Larkinella soli TaxID=1770527 RepID=UPI000FFC4935|nr:hypothetical protein [Larkinella soli]
MTISGALLNVLCRRYRFVIDESVPVLFAVRSALPVEIMRGNFTVSGTFKSAHPVRPVRLNYQTVRCTVGIWIPSSGEVALFPGSTVPSAAYVYRHPDSRATFNILKPGLYRLKRGLHPRSERGFQRHPAFLMDGYGLVEVPGLVKAGRTARFDFRKVQYKVMLPGDNLHAARTEPEAGQDSRQNCLASLRLPYSSSGCITVTGQPAPYVRNPTADSGWNCWMHFSDLLDRPAFRSGQYDLLLFDDSDLAGEHPSASGGSLRYGSTGPDVARVQKILGSVLNGKTGRPFYEGPADGSFTGATASAYLHFQETFTRGPLTGQVDLRPFLNATKHFR